MSYVNQYAKDFISSAVVHLNQTGVKESVKNAAGAVTFVFGLIELYDISLILLKKKDISEIDRSQSLLFQVAQRVAILSAKISMILSGAVSRPGVYIITKVATSCFSHSQLIGAFGTNTIFAVNPYHPRHVASILAIALATPLLAETFVTQVCCLAKKIAQIKRPSIIKGNTLISDQKIIWVNFFNLITSRPALHLGNQLASAFVRG